MGGRVVQGLLGRRMSGRGRRKGAAAQLAGCLQACLGLTVPLVSVLHMHSWSPAPQTDGGKW